MLYLSNSYFHRHCVVVDSTVIFAAHLTDSLAIMCWCAVKKLLTHSTPGSCCTPSSPMRLTKTTFSFFRRGRLCSSKGGACAMAQWHNGQSKSGPHFVICIIRSLCCMCCGVTYILAAVYNHVIQRKQCPYAAVVPDKLRHFDVNAC